MELKKIFIVAGHGLSRSGKHDNGASAIDGTTERDIITKVCKSFNNNLICKIGVDNRLTLLNKIRLINELCKSKSLNHKNSILVSVHVDYRGASSGEMAYYYRESIRSKELASKIINELPLKNKRVIPDNFSRFGRIGIIRDTIPLACLVEIGSLGQDLKYLKNNTRDIADSILDSVLEFGGIGSKDLIKVSEWAKKSAKKAKTKKIIKNWSNPQEIIGNQKLSHILINLGLATKAQDVTLEQFAVVLDRANLI